jgi:hypothetical protein
LGQAVIMGDDTDRKLAGYWDKQASRYDRGME